MNANELADELLNNVEAEYFESGGDIWADITDESWKIIQDSATMLRQQQAKLDEWESAPLIVMICQLQAENEALKVENKALIDSIVRGEK